MAEVVIVASAFGVDSIRREGHGARLSTTAAAGAHGIEVRRELFATDADASHAALARLGADARARGLWTVYSAPMSLYADGRLAAHTLAAAQAEADALGARFLKLQLGEFAGDADADGIRRATEGGRARLLVENGQRPEDGALEQFVALFHALERAGEGARDLIGMTFDIGNWQWTGQAPLAAASALAAHVEYIHCKDVAGEGGRRFACAPALDDPSFPAIFALLPRAVPRAIEFPLDDRALAEDAVRRVAWLAAV
ncbi:sugar phosphate isomerase/epimerase [Trinickia sp. LjRoot230]|uniref:sugar phosphate isomerase/epimerase n=1 Tax=Trinickia sp. LjRoot230 TaxID=3342288 RepID=UPI003ECE2709